MHLINSIYKNGLESAHASCLRAQVYSNIIEDIVKYMGIYPNKDKYIDFAIKYEFNEPLHKLSKMTNYNKD